MASYDKKNWREIKKYSLYTEKRLFSNVPLNRVAIFPAIVIVVISSFSHETSEVEPQVQVPIKVVENKQGIESSGLWLELYAEHIAIQNSVFLESAKIENQKYNPFPYSEQNWSEIRTYLESYNSMLSESPYFEVIIDVGMEKNIDPRILFAITGQEQSFVRKGSVSAKRIANNPFNVYNSWKNYNTEIRDSAEIAANTVLNTMAQTPYNVHPIKALNKRYAEDPRWWIGVDYFYNEMLSIESMHLDAVTN